MASVNTPQHSTRVFISFFSFYLVVLSFISFAFYVLCLTIPCYQLPHPTANLLRANQLLAFTGNSAYTAALNSAAALSLAYLKIELTDLKSIYDERAVTLTVK